MSRGSTNSGLAAATSGKASPRASPRASMSGLAQQRRSWEFDKEEGILDSSKLHKIITDPLTPLSFKTEKETSFKDTVLTMLVDSSGSMRGRSMQTWQALVRNPILKSQARYT